MIDVTDATFEQEVLARSAQVPVVVDLWAPWCGPCRTLGPILEKVVGATEGAVELAKVNVDENPMVARSFQVQSIPAVYALADAKVVDGFLGAQPEHVVSEFVARLAAPPSEADQLVAQAATAGADAEPLLRRALELEHDHPAAVLALAELLVDRGETEQAMTLLGRVPETPEVRQVMANARLAAQHVDVSDDGIDELLTGLLERVRDDDAARQEFVDVLERLGPNDPRTAAYRRQLSARLF